MEKITTEFYIFLLFAETFSAAFHDLYILNILELAHYQILLYIFR